MPIGSLEIEIHSFPQYFSIMIFRHENKYFHFSLFPKEDKRNNNIANGFIMGLCCKKTCEMAHGLKAPKAKNRGF